MKRFIMMALIGAMMCLGVTGCGAKSASKAYTKVTIQGKQYDLTEQPDKLIAKMVKNGLWVIDTDQVIPYGEDGCLTNVFPDGTKMLENGAREQHPIVNVAAHKRITEPTDSIEKILVSRNTYSLSLSDSLKLEVETKAGISTETPDEVPEEMHVVNAPRDKEAVILFFDGEKVDLEQYRPSKLTAEKAEEYETLMRRYGLYDLDYQMYLDHSYPYGDAPEAFLTDIDYGEATEYALIEGALRIDAGTVNQVVMVRVNHLFYSVSVMQKDYPVEVFDTEVGKYRWIR